jgi:hypothetical protein
LSLARTGEGGLASWTVPEFTAAGGAGLDEAVHAADVFLARSKMLVAQGAGSMPASTLTATVSGMNAPGGREDPLRSDRERLRRRGWRVATLVVVTAGFSTAAGLLINLVTSDRRLPDWLDSADQAASVLGVLVAVVGLLLALLTWSRVPRKRGPGRSEEPAKATVERRIEAATQSLQSAAELVDELQVEMQAKVAALDRLRAENDEFEKLAAVRREEAEAVSRLIESAISGAHSRLSRSTRRDQALFFLAGLATSIPVQLLISWLT